MLTIARINSKKLIYSTKPFVRFNPGTKASNAARIVCAVYRGKLCSPFRDSYEWLFTLKKARFISIITVETICFMMIPVNYLENWLIWILTDYHAFRNLFLNAFNAGVVTTSDMSRMQWWKILFSSKFGVCSFICTALVRVLAVWCNSVQISLEGLQNLDGQVLYIRWSGRIK